MADVIQSPYTWLVLLLVFLGGWYAKRSIFDGLVVTAVAPVVLMALWFVMYIVSVLTLCLIIGFVGLIFPDFPMWVEGAVRELPDLVVNLFHPATVCTAVGFYFYCRYERTNTSPPPAGFSASDGNGYIGQPMRDPEPKFNPGVTRFRG